MHVACQTLSCCRCDRFLAESEQLLQSDVKYSENLAISTSFASQTGRGSPVTLHRLSGGTGLATVAVTRKSAAGDKRINNKGEGK
jgi:hypothetical protein